MDEVLFYCLNTIYDEVYNTYKEYTFNSTLNKKRYLFVGKKYNKLENSLSNYNIFIIKIIFFYTKDYLTFLVDWLGVFLRKN